ncbi:MAG: SGNH/GDSL hydrolase family protein [Kiritimatiellae bacterium]|nr:SGNH/GDSL hydrolase family protein [Kiritimatiellia bacterium]
MNDIDAQNALVLRSGIDRFVGRLKRREPVRILYFGTSVTYGEWPNHVTRWLRARHPDVRIEDINVSIGGTASDLGVFRVGHDVIAHRPDLVLVEFCNDVSDGGAVEVAYQMDGILHQIHAALPDADIVVVHVARQTYTELYARNECPPHIVRHEEAAERHQVPSIHASRVVAASITRGRRAWTDIAGDIIHPNDEGHRLLADIVCECLARMETATGGSHPLPPPLNAAYAHTHLTPVTAQDLRVADPERARGAWRHQVASGALTRDWPERVDYYGKYFPVRMPDIWTLNRPGDTLRHEFEGTMIGLYDVHGPDTGSIAVRIDGLEVGTFDRSMGGGLTIYRLSNGIMFSRSLAPGRHTVEVTLLDKRTSSGSPTILLAGYWMEG